MTDVLDRDELNRATLMRGTLHLMTTKDYLALRPALQPMLSEGMQAVLGDRAKGLDLDRVTATARASLDEQPRTFEDLHGPPRPSPRVKTPIRFRLTNHA